MSSRFVSLLLDNANEETKKDVAPERENLRKESENNQETLLIPFESRLEKVCGSLVRKNKETDDESES